MARKFGSELKIGDTIETWWSPGRDTIVALTPYHGPLKCFEPAGAQIAGFALNKIGMTIENGGLYSTIEPKETP